MEKIDINELVSVPLTTSYWEKVYDGGGHVTFDSTRNELLLSPQAPQVPEQTFAALVILKKLKFRPVQNYVVRVEVSTEKQLRATAPNEWEVFWFFGNYRKSEKGTKEANYFILKPQAGIELGVVFDEVGQKFLKTNSAPVLEMGRRTELIFLKRGSRFRVYQDQVLILDYQDGEAAGRLYEHPGTFGLYSEDAQVRVHAFSYKELK